MPSPMLNLRARLAASANHCATCGKPLRLDDRLLGRTECAADRAKTSSSRDHARARYLGALTAFDLNTQLTPSQERTLSDADQEALGVKWRTQVAESAIAYVLEQALADDVLTVDEDRQITRLATLADVDVDELIGATPQLAPRVIAARANSGRLPVIANPATGLRRREICHVETPATLMTDASGTAPVTNRGIAVAKGTQLEYGRLSGHLVEMNPDLRGWDSGMLLVTSQRLFFEGDHLGIQVPHRRLIGFTLFRDGLQVRIAGRHAEPIFRIAEPLVVAAIAGGAWAGSAPEPSPKVPAAAPREEPVRTAGSGQSG